MGSGGKVSQGEEVKFDKDKRLFAKKTKVLVICVRPKKLTAVATLLIIGLK